MNDHDPYTQMLRRTVGILRLGRPRTHRNLCVLPLVSTVECQARYVLLESAISRGTLTVTEVSEAGSVPYLVAVNKGPWPVLIFDGEELVGAKQNRICNATILVGVGKSVLPVSCVEQGRWSHTSAFFHSGTYAAHPRLRMQKEALVRRSATAAAAHTGTGETRRRGARLESQQERAGRFSGAQGEVWAEVSDMSYRLGVRSETMALADNVKTRGDDVEEYVQALDLDKDASLTNVVGTMVFIGGRLVCADILQPGKRFRQLYPKLLRGYALEALATAESPEGSIDHARGRDTPAFGRPETVDFDPEASALRLLAELNGARLQTQTSVDLGQDLRLEAGTVSGSGLSWNEDIIQLSLFPKEAA